jgi:hypothetical protein
MRYFIKLIIYYHQMYFNFHLQNQIINKKYTISLNINLVTFHCFYFNLFS